VVAERTESQPIEWLTGREQDVWRRLLSVQCRLRERLDQELHASSGLTLAEYDVLVHLSEAPNRSLRMSELAARLLLSRSGLTRRVDGMVREGLVVRRPCDDDGRGALAELTTTGMTRLERAAPVHVEGVRRYLLGPVTASDPSPPGGDTRRRPDQPPGPAETSLVERNRAGTDRLTGLAQALGRIERALDGK
jgi:DNA-binding MarR family transcriptional regulator